MAYERRDFAGGAVVTSLASGLSAIGTSFELTEATGWPDGSDGDFFVVIDPDTSSEEKIRCSELTGTTVTVASSGRGADGTSATTHASAATVMHVFTALDADEANYWVAELAGATNTAGDLLTADGADSLTTLAKGSNSTFLGVSSAGTLGYRKILAADVDADIATQAELDAHTGDTADAHDASAISFSPVGTIAGDDVQEAVAEVATDAATALSTHDADTTSVHGIADTSVLVVDDDLTAVPRGVLGYAETTEPQTGITTEATVLTAPAVTVGADRRIRVRVVGSVSNTSGDSFLFIKEGATYLRQAGINTAGSGQSLPHSAEVILEPSAGEHTYIARVASAIATIWRPNPSGSQDALEASFIIVEDIGST